MGENSGYYCLVRLAVPSASQFRIRRIRILILGRIDNHPMNKNGYFKTRSWKNWVGEARKAMWPQRHPPPDYYAEPAEELPAGHQLPWTTWKTLNRLRNQVTRCRDNMVRWGYSERYKQWLTFYPVLSVMPPSPYETCPEPLPTPLKL